MNFSLAVQALYKVATSAERDQWDAKQKRNSVIKGRLVTKQPFRSSASVNAECDMVRLTIDMKTIEAQKLINKLSEV